MTDTFYSTRNYRTDHTKFGGIICPSDFNTDYRGKDNNNGSTIAKRIVADAKFDKQCKKYIEDRERNKQYGK